MRIVGITGPSGSGKTDLTEYFAQRGIPTIDADELYHSMLVPPSACLDEIANVFGNSVINNNGTLNRSMLSSIVFNNPEKLQLLNNTVLKLVIQKTRQLISEYEEKGHRIIIIDAPTLIESGFNKECDVVISVISNKSFRVKRIAQRDGISESKALERVNAQKDDIFYESHSNHVIRNDGTKQQFIDSLSSLEYLFQ